MISCDAKQRNILNEWTPQMYHLDILSYFSRKKTLLNMAKTTNLTCICCASKKEYQQLQNRFTSTWYSTTLCFRSA